MLPTRSFVACAAVLVSTGMAVQAMVVPTAPWSTVVDQTGGACDIQWNLDTSGSWTNMSIFFVTGSNQDFVTLETVASGIDGTTGSGKYSWMCPAVTPNAQIYFYSFSNNGEPVETWTTRFTISDASGNVVAAPNANQPDGSAVPWGNGQLVGGSSSSSSSGSNSSANTLSSSVSSTASTQSASSSSKSSKNAGAASVSAASSSSSSPSSALPSSSDDNDNSTTVITVTPTDSSSRTSASHTTSVTSGVGGNAASVDSSSSTSASSGASSTGSAVSSHGSVAGIGLALAIMAGLCFA